MQEDVGSMADRQPQEYKNKYYKCVNIKKKYIKKKRRSSRKGHLTPKKKREKEKTANWP